MISYTHIDFVASSATRRFRKQSKTGARKSRHLRCWKGRTPNPTRMGRKWVTGGPSVGRWWAAGGSLAAQNHLRLPGGGPTIAKQNGNRLRGVINACSATPLAIKNVHIIVYIDELENSNLSTPDFSQTNAFPIGEHDQTRMRMVIQGF